MINLIIIGVSDISTEKLYDYVLLKRIKHSGKCIVEIFKQIFSHKLGTDSGHTIATTLT